MLEKILPFLKEVIARAGTKFLIAALAIYCVFEIVKVPEIELTKMLVGIGGIVLTAAGFYVFRYFTDKFNKSKGDKSQ